MEFTVNYYWIKMEIVKYASRGDEKYT